MRSTVVNGALPPSPPPPPSVVIGVLPVPPLTPGSIPVVTGPSSPGVGSDCGHHKELAKNKNHDRILRHMGEYLQP